MNSDLDKDFATLELMSRARHSFIECLVERSESRDEADVLSYLRLDKMFEFAEFFYTIRAMGLTDPGDVAILADLHNGRIARLMRDRAALDRRGLKQERLLDSMFTIDVLPRLEMIWNEQPGALDQSNLGRLLVTQMSAETVRGIAVATEKAGFIRRRRHPTGAIVITSLGVMEDVMGSCLRTMRCTIADL